MATKTGYHFYSLSVLRTEKKQQIKFAYLWRRHYVSDWCKQIWCDRRW